MEELAAESGATEGRAQSHALKRELSLWDLVPMQILLVVGVTWPGIAAKQGGTHIWFWLAAILFLFIPLAAVVGWCAQVWPLEGGVYQWTKFALGPFAGFMSAWNFGMWALLAVSNVGILTATSLSYGLGPRAAWMEDNHTLIAGFTIALFLVILFVNLPGFGIGRWVSHFGTAVTVLVTVLLMGLLFFHPHCQRGAPACEPAGAVQFWHACADAVQHEHLHQDCLQRPERPGAGCRIRWRDAQSGPHDHALGVDRRADHCG